MNAQVGKEPKSKDFYSHVERAFPSFYGGYIFLYLMDKIEILESLESAHGTYNPLEVSESDRWQLYETIKSHINCSTNPDDYTRQIILISETLEL